MRLACGTTKSRSTELEDFHLDRNRDGTLRNFSALSMHTRDSAKIKLYDATRTCYDPSEYCTHNYTRTEIIHV